MPTNRQIVLDNRPEAEAIPSNFKLVSADTPALADGQVLLNQPGIGNGHLEPGERNHFGPQ